MILHYINNLLTLFSYEINKLIKIPSSYLTVSIFLFVSGLIYTSIIKGYYVEASCAKSAALLFFSSYQILFFFIPLITMSSISEQNKSGLLKRIQSNCCPPFTIVISKFFAYYLFYIFLWITTLILPIIFDQIIDSNASKYLVDWHSNFLCLSFIALSGLFFISIGILASSVTKNTPLAGTLSLAFLALFILAGNSLNLEEYGLRNDSSIQYFLDFTQTLQHLQDFSNGIIDIRIIIFYISATLVSLALSIFSLKQSS